MATLFPRPDRQLLKQAYHNLQDKVSHAPLCARTLDGWVKYFESDHLHYDPMIVIDGGTVAAIVWFTDYDAEARLAQIHFIAQRTANPVAVYRSLRRAVSDIGEHGDIDVAFGIIPASNEMAMRTATTFGMKVLATTQHLAYTAIEL